MVRPGDTFVDVGSNLGIYSLYVARLLGGHGRVFAFEPDPDTFGVLLRNIESNGLTHVIRAEEKALTNANTPLEFFPVPEEPMMSSFLPQPGSEAKAIRVSGVRLDDYLNGLGVGGVDIIKLDLEGAEPMALQGMAASLQSSRLLIIEVNRPQLNRIGLDPVDLIREVMATRRFDSLFRIDAGADALPRLEEHSLASAMSEYAIVNVVCARHSMLPSILRQLVA
ncbi:MAG: FkbM family methyltransferase [Terriglobia bacterium]|jgi:FkbM family methyltransferase